MISSKINSGQTLINFPAELIGPGQIWRSQMPSEKDLPMIKNELRISVIVQLCLDAEFSQYGKASTRGLYEKLEFNVIKFPIPDFEVPEDVEKLEAVIDQILDTTRRGENVLIHCMAGRGRTGLIIACIAKKVFNISSGKEAIEWVRKFIPGAVENQLQCNFVDKFLNGPSEVIPPQTTEMPTQTQAMTREQKYQVFRARQQERQSGASLVQTTPLLLTYPDKSEEKEESRLTYRPKEERKSQKEPNKDGPLNTKKEEFEEIDLKLKRSLYGILNEDSSEEEANCCSSCIVS